MVEGIAARELAARSNLVIVSDHGHTPVLNDDLHSLGTDGDDEPPAWLTEAGFRVRPFTIELDALAPGEGLIELVPKAFGDKPALVRGDFRVIGATTDQEYDRWVRGDPALERRFQRVGGTDIRFGVAGTNPDTGDGYIDL
mgnify:CR=1 FL=1